MEIFKIMFLNNLFLYFPVDRVTVDRHTFRVAISRFYYLKPLK